MNIKNFNKLSTEEQHLHLQSCCGSSSWISKMADFLPFKSAAQVLSSSDAVFNILTQEDAREAFAFHPRIGDVEELEKRFGKSGAKSSAEQSGIADSPREILEKLAELNTEYEKRFGYIFIVCASGKSAEEMIAILEERISAKPELEWRTALNEQRKITSLRLEKFFDMASISTHVLNTASGTPAGGMTLRLYKWQLAGWDLVSERKTDKDGRVGDLASGVENEDDHYKMVFETGSWFAENKQACLYPQVTVEFKLIDDSHYHIPLLISPFSYSTYRGS